MFISRRRISSSSSSSKETNEECADARVSYFGDCEIFVLFYNGKKKRRNKRKKQNPFNFGQIVLNPFIFGDLAKTIVICTPERELARENNRKATNNDRGTRVFVFVG